MAQPVKTEIQYDENLETLLKEEAEKSESLSILHRMSHERFSFWSNIINIPIILGSAGVGFATGIDLGNNSQNNIILGLSSVIIGCIKSLDSYFQLSRRTETHRIVSLQYAQINKRIAIELALNREDRITAKDMLNIIKTDIKNLEEIAPLIPEEIIDKYNKKYQNEQNVKKPNITNGLTPIRVNTPDDDVPPPAAPPSSPKMPPQEQPYIVNIDDVKLEDNEEGLFM
jgi:hypothetical protein